jgi:ABC-type transport system involved in multi-copper enzyme maturation permease subunit
MLTNVRYILLTALRDWLFFGLIASVAIAIWVSRVLGSTALVEAQEMALSFGGASSRVIIMIGLIVFVCFHVRQAFDSKEIDVFLSRPIHRNSLVFSYWIGFVFVALLLVLPTGLILAWSGILHTNGFWVWLLSLFLETCIVTALALFASFTLRSATFAVMTSMGFYVLSRMMGFFMLSSESHMMFGQEWLNSILKYTITIVSMIIPRLDFYANSDWLVYGVERYQDITNFILQTVVFVPLLLLASMLDFRRRQF